MKVILPKNKKVNELSPKERERLLSLMEQQLRDVEEKDLCLMLDKFMKMACISLHDNFGFGERRLTRFLGSFRRIFAKQQRYVRDGTQDQMLDARIKEIFKSGYPDDFFGKMFSDWNINTNGGVNEDQT